jgi:glutathione S-transferase
MDLYDSRNSGNGWKVRLLLAHLGLRYERHVLNLAEGAARTPEFLKLNPLARVPVLVTDDGYAIVESNAILLHLAAGTPFLPDARDEKLRVLQWLFFEQADHMRFMARPRFLVSIAKVADKHQQEIEYLRGIGAKALAAIEAQLSRTPFMAGERYTIADIALFPYTSMAEMGGYDLQPFPAIRAWVRRVESQPGFVPLIPA